MNFGAVIDEINSALDSTDRETTNTSMRVPVALRDAAALAVRELGSAESTTALTTVALRAALEAIVMQAVLDHHFSEYPHTRPTLADLAIAAAELDDHPLADSPEALRRAATEVVVLHPNADADDVLLWAEARAFSLA